MHKAQPPTLRSQRLLEKVYQAIGANRIHERWIDDEEGVLGLASDDGIITISPQTMVSTILHECLHQAFPDIDSEPSIARMTSYLYNRLSDGDCKRLWEAYDAKVQRMKRSTKSA